MFYDSIARLHAFYQPHFAFRLIEQKPCGRKVGGSSDRAQAQTNAVDLTVSRVALAIQPVQRTAHNCRESVYKLSTSSAKNRRKIDTRVADKKFICARLTPSGQQEEPCIQIRRSKTLKIHAFLLDKLSICRFHKILSLFF